MDAIGRDDLNRLYDKLSETNDRLGEVVAKLAAQDVRIGAVERDVNEAHGKARDAQKAAENALNEHHGLGWKILLAISPGLAALAWRLLER